METTWMSMSLSTLIAGAHRQDHKETRHGVMNVQAMKGNEAGTDQKTETSLRGIVSDLAPTNTIEETATGREMDTHQLGRAQEAADPQQVLKIRAGIALQDAVSLLTAANNAGKTVAVQYPIMRRKRRAESGSLAHF
jgi:hypothetical protein